MTAPPPWLSLVHVGLSPSLWPHLGQAQESGDNLQTEVHDDLTS